MKSRIQFINGSDLVQSGSGTFQNEVRFPESNTPSYPMKLRENIFRKDGCLKSKNSTIHLSKAAEYKKAIVSIFEPV